MTIDFAQKQVVVTVTPSNADSDAFVQALTSAGFGGSVLKTATITGPKAAPKTGESKGSNSGLPDGEDPPSKKKVGATSSGAFGTHVSARAELDHDALRPGDSFRIAVIADIGEGWHIYGNPIGPGVGKPTVLSAEAPKGIQLDPARYAPAHKAEQDFGKAGKTWVWEYTGKNVLYLSGRVSKTAQPGTIDLPITLAGQVCSAGSCVPGRLTVSVSIRIVPKESPSKPVHADLFVAFDQAQPVGE